MNATRQVTIQNHAGIHCRPSAAIIEAVKKFPDVSLTLKSAKGDIDLNSILSLLTLALQEGDKVTLVASGPQANEAVQVIGDLFEHHFDFPPQS